MINRITQVDFVNASIAADAICAAPSVVINQANSEALDTINITTAEPTDASISSFFSLPSVNSL